jgi:amino acid adenylation domain-containing protein
MTVLDLVAARARKTPDATALISSNEHLTYRQLDLRTNQLANHVRGLGVGPGSVVGLCLNRSIALLVGALGIMKAGAAYLPIDVSTPSSRMLLMLRDARVTVVLTEAALVDAFTSDTWHVVDVDGVASTLGAAQQSPPLASVSGEDLAYVIYTSGSTGLPKGVAVTHDNLTNLVGWHQCAIKVTHSDRATQLASPAFDAAVWEVWPYLAAGACVAIPDEDTRADPIQLSKWLLAERITVSYVPTPMAEVLMTLDWPSTTALRTILTGGDTLHRYPAPALPFEVVNNYGPTETTVVATSGVVPPSERCFTILPSIGRPISNVFVYLLDEDRNPVPPGELGELYIGGRGVARGYLNREELTAERFVPDPFIGRPGARMYRTGDLGRTRPDGDIEFAGRTDDQVKIRGYRIELGEVEAVLSSHPNVRQAAVIARDDSPAGKRLVAYVVLDDPSAAVQETLQGFLRGLLPAYMVPGVIISMPQLPLTTNGKVDRRALPAPTAGATNSSQPGATARTLIEGQLASMVAALLQLESVGLDDNFFLLGGHSLLAAQLLVQVRDRFGVDLELRTLFERPTVAGLSSAVEQQIVAGLEAMSEEEAQRLLA